MNINNKEIERKWLIKNLPTDILDKIKNMTPLDIHQYYVSDKPHIRIRKVDNDTYLTFKESISDNDIIRKEYEFKLDNSVYDEWIDKNIGLLIHKQRYKINIDDSHILELDIFKDEYDGLKYVEIEFNDIEDSNKFKPLDWFDKELTGIKKYNNLSLSINPIKVNEIYGK